MQTLFEECIGDFPISWSETKATNAANYHFARQNLHRSVNDPTYYLPQTTSEHNLSDFEVSDERLFHRRPSILNFLSNHDNSQDFDTSVALSEHRRTMKQVYENNELLERFKEGYNLGLGINQYDFHKRSPASENQFSRVEMSIPIEKQEDKLQSELYTRTEQRPIRKKGWRKPPDMPKRPMSSYNLFFQLERERLINDMPDKVYTESDVNRIAAICKLKEMYSGGQQQKRKHRKTHGKISFATLARVTANKWKELPDEQKQPFIQRAIIEKQKYQNAVEAWSKSKMKDSQTEISKDKVEMEPSNDGAAESNKNPIVNALDEALKISSTTTDQLFVNAISEETETPVQSSTPPADLFTDLKDKETVHVVSPLDRTPEKGEKELKYFTGDIGTSVSLLELLGCSRKRRKTEDHRLHDSPDINHNQEFTRNTLFRNSSRNHNSNDVYDIQNDDELDEVDEPPPIKEVAIKTRILQKELNSAVCDGKQRTPQSHQKVFTNAGIAQGFSPSFSNFFENDAFCDPIEIMENSNAFVQAPRDFHLDEFSNDLQDFPLETSDDMLYPDFQDTKRPRFHHVPAANRSRAYQSHFPLNGSEFNKRLLAEYYRLKRRVNLLDEHLDVNQGQGQRPPLSVHETMRSFSPGVTKRFDTLNFQYMDQRTIDPIPSNLNLSANRGCIVTPSRSPKKFYRRSQYMRSPEENEEALLGQMMQEAILRRYNGPRSNCFTNVDDDPQPLQQVGRADENKNLRDDSFLDPMFANETSNRFVSYSNSDQECQSSSKQHGYRNDSHISPAQEKGQYDESSMTFASRSAIEYIEANPVRNEIYCDASMEADPNNNSVYEV